MICVAALNPQGDGNWRWPELFWGTPGTPGDPVTLRAGRCSACDGLSFPVLRCCSWCGERNVEARPLPSKAIIVATTSVLHPVPGGEISPPYVVALARLQGTDLEILGVTDCQVDERPLPGHIVDVVVVEPFSTPGLMHYAFSTSQDNDS